MFKFNNEIDFRGDVGIQTLVGKNLKDGEVAVVLAALKTQFKPGEKVSDSLDILDAAIQTKLTFTNEKSIEILVEKLMEAHKTLVQRRMSAEAKAKEEAAAIENAKKPQETKNVSGENFNRLVKKAILEDAENPGDIKNPISYCFHNVFRSKNTGKEVVSNKCFASFAEAVADGIDYPNYIKTITKVFFVGDIEIINSNSDLKEFFENASQDL